jgi:DNA-binding CsgD family transcriptional regulator
MVPSALSLAQPRAASTAPDAEPAPNRLKPTVAASPEKAEPDMDPSVSCGGAQPLRLAEATVRVKDRLLVVEPGLKRAEPVLVTRAIFLATAAVAVIIRHQLNRPLDKKAQRALTEALGLTNREADVAMALGEGLNLAEVAERLRIGVGTARSHLRSIFAKTDARRQAELIAWLIRLRP